MNKLNTISIPEKIPATLFDRSWSAIPGSIAIHCIFYFAGQIDKDRVRRAARLTLDAEPILACRFVERWYLSHWRRYENPESLDIFEYRTSTDRNKEIQDFFEMKPDLPLKILLLRDHSDILCIKLNHHVGDGKAVQEYAYLLAKIYNHLEGDPEYKPIPNADNSRNLVQLGNQFTFSDKWKILRQAINTNRRMRNLGQWEYPVPESTSPEYKYVTWRLDSRRVNTIFEYGCRHRATVTQVLLAALYIAIYEELSPSTRLPLPASMAIDLRRYLPAQKAPAIANYIGVAVVDIDPDSFKSLDAVVKRIRDQMKSQQKFLGLPVSFFPLEVLPVIRHLVTLLPNSPSRRSKKSINHAIESKNYVKGWIIVSNAGELDIHRLDFGGVEITDAFTTGGVFRFPGLLALGISQFKGSLTLYLGCGQSDVVNNLYHRMMELLPDQPGNLS